MGKLRRGSSVSVRCFRVCSKVKIVVIRSRRLIFREVLWVVFVVFRLSVYFRSCTR